MAFSLTCMVNQPYYWYLNFMDEDLSKLQLLSPEDGNLYSPYTAAASRSIFRWNNITFTELHDNVKVFCRFNDEIAQSLIDKYWAGHYFYMYRPIKDALSPAGKKESYILGTRLPSATSFTGARAFTYPIAEGYDPAYPWRIVLDSTTSTAKVNDDETFMSVTHSSNIEVYGKVYNETTDEFKGEFWKFEDDSIYCCPAWHTKTYPTNEHIETTSIFVKNISSETITVLSHYTGNSITIASGAIECIDKFDSQILTSSTNPVKCNYSEVDINGVNCIFDEKINASKLFTLNSSNNFITSFYSEGNFSSTGNPVLISSNKVRMDNWTTSEHSYHTGETYFHGVINDPSEWNYLKNTLGYHEPYTREGSDDTWCQNGHEVSLPMFTAKSISESSVTYAVGQDFNAHSSPTYHEYEWKRGSNWCVGATFVCPCIRIINMCPDNTFFILRSYHGNIELHYGEAAYVPKDYIYWSDLITGKYGGYMARSDESGVIPLDPESVAERRDWDKGTTDKILTWSSGISNVANVLHTKTSYPITDYILEDIVFTKAETERTVSETYSSRYLGSVYLSENTDNNNFDDPTTFMFHLNETNRARLDTTEHIAVMYRDNSTITESTLCVYPMQINNVTKISNQTSALIDLFDKDGTEYFYEYDSPLYYVDKYNYKIKCTSIADRVLVYGQTYKKDTSSTRGGLYPLLENVSIPVPSYENKITSNEYRQGICVICPIAKKIKMTVDGIEVFKGSLNPNEYKTLYKFPNYNDYATHIVKIEEVIGAESRLYLKNATMDINLLDQNNLNIFIIEKEKTVQVSRFDTEENCAIFYCSDIVESGTYKCAIHWKPTDINEFIESGINVLYRPTNYWEQMDPYNNIHTTYQYITFETDGTDVYFEDSLFNDTTRKNDIPEPSDQVYELIGKTSDYIICQNNCSVRARIQYNGSNIGDPFTLENNINYSVPNENYIQGQYTVIFEAYNSNSNIACLATSSINDTKTIIERSSWQAVDSAIHTNSSFLSPVITTSTENVYRITTRDLALAEEAYGIHDYFNPDYTNGTMTYYNIIDQTVWEDKILFVWYSSYRYLRLNNAKPSERQDYNHQIVSNDKNNFGISIKITNSDNWNNLITKYHLAAPLSNVTSSLPEWCINDDTIYIPAAADPNTDYIAFAFTGYNSSTPSIVPGYSYYGGNSKLNDKYVIEPCYELKTDLVSTVGLSAVGTNLSGKKDIYMSAGRDNLYRFENNLHSGPSKYITVYKNGVQVGRYVCAAWRYTTFRVANVLPGDLVEIKSDPEDSKPKINVGGVWKDSDGYISIGGTWKKINKVYVYKDGIWKECK